jgi:hypothetical protein
MITVDIKILILVTLLFVMLTYIYLANNQINEPMDNITGVSVSTPDLKSPFVSTPDLKSPSSVDVASPSPFVSTPDLKSPSSVDVASPSPFVSTPDLKSPSSVDVTSPFLTSPLVIGNKLCAANGNTCIDAQNLAPLLRAWQFPYIYSIKPTDYVVYDDIFAAYNKVFTKSGAPVGWNDTNYEKAPWNGYKILAIGVGKKTDPVPQGIRVTVPPGMSVIWLRVLNCDRWTTLTVKGNVVDIVNTTGYRSTIKMRPDGAEDVGTCHRWVPYPVPGAGTYYVFGAVAPYSSSGNWISGIGFSKNPYNHAMSSAVTYKDNQNGGSGVGWSGSSWPGGHGSNTDGGDNLAHISKGKTANLAVPVVNSGADKMLYLLSTGRQSDSGYARQFKVYVNRTLVDSFYPYDNVFSRYYNSRQNLSYLGARIPANLINGEKFSVTLLTVTIDASGTGILDNVGFREVGTHDY